MRMRSKLPFGDPLADRLADVISKVVNEHRKFNIRDPLARKIFNGPNTGWPA